MPPPVLPNLEANWVGQRGQATLPYLFILTFVLLYERNSPELLSRSQTTLSHHQTNESLLHRSLPHENIRHCFPRSLLQLQALETFRVGLLPLLTSPNPAVDQIPFLIPSQKQVRTQQSLLRRLAPLSPLPMNVWTNRSKTRLGKVVAHLLPTSTRWGDGHRPRTQSTRHPLDHLPTDWFEFRV